MTMSADAVESPGVERIGGRVPDFFIVGHHKSGTTAMYEMLRRHPQIYMPEMKEPEFFGRDLSRRRESPGGSPQSRKTFAGSRPHTFEEYLSLFVPAAPEQQVGEASPSYLSSSAAAAQIAEVQPAARIVAILREPASFLRSLHLQMVQNHVQSEWDLRKALADDDAAGESGGALRYAERVRYVEQLGRYHDVFCREQVLVLIYDDFRADNEATIRAVLRFLDVDAEAPIAAFDANPTVVARSRRLEDVSRRLKAGRGPLARAVKATFRSVTPPKLRRDAVRAFQRNVVYGSAPPPDEQLMLELRQRFKGEVVALSEYLDRDLVGLWGYDRIE
jgi:hypothetical protein